MASKHPLPRHVVAIPYPAQGHINPLLQLCEQLVPCGFSFTFINTHHIHHRLHRAGHICPAHHAPYRHKNGSCHVQDAHRLKNTACQNEDAHVPHAHLDEDGQKPHHGQGADANDADPGADTRDAYDGDDVRAHEVYNYKGCSSIRMVFVAGGCAPEKHGHISTTLEAFRAAQDMCEPVENLLSELIEEQVVDFIMSDVLLGWSSATAHKFGLPWVCFWAASAATLSAFIYFSDLVDQGDAFIPIAEMEDGEAPLLEGIPGLPPTSQCDVPKVWDAEGKVHEGLSKYFKKMEQACLVVLNTCEALEGQVLEALSKRFPIHPVGPLLPSLFMLHTCPDNKQDIPLVRPSLFTEDSSCLAWLNTQAPSSVLFISFGSISLRSEEQLHELSKGVQATGCPFLWVSKPDISLGPDNNGQYQHNGLEGDHPRGLIVPWAPQLQVLSHPSVGGFITHCGWNSVIESVSMGVPMLCWADMGERSSNQRLVVEFWKCGIDMVADSRRGKQHIDEAVLVGQDDVEKSIRFLMLEEGGASIRVNSTKMREAAIEAYEESHARLSEFSQIMKDRCLHLGENSR